MYRPRPAVLGLALCLAASRCLTAQAQPAAPNLPAAGPATSTPAATVERFHARLGEAMAQSAKLGCEGRIKLLQPAVDATFDLPFIAERALRRHWKTLDADQQQRFTEALQSSFVTTYATEFASPGAVRFTTGKSETIGRGDALVHTLLAPREGSAVTLDYVLKARGPEWRVVNVLADGVSDLALRATQYDGLMKADGLAALLARLEAQTAALKARCK